MQGFCILSRVYRQAPCSWHFLWQISVTTKGYNVNTRWQILKLACFHNCHFWRGERPFSGTVKSLPVWANQHPRTSSHRSWLWKCHYSILEKLEQLCFFCNNYVFWNETRKNIIKARARKAFTDQSTTYSRRIKSKGLGIARWWRACVARTRLWGQSPGLREGNSRMKGETQISTESYIKLFPG